MQIAQIAPLTEAIPPKLYGGTERIISWLTDELVALGHEVVLFASGDSRTSATWNHVGRRHCVWTARSANGGISGLFCQWRTNVSLVFSIRRMLLESSAAAPSNETRIAQAPVAERPVALPPARRWSCKCGSRYSP
jgi:hypothetical protein